MEKISGYQLSLMGGTIVCIVSLINVPAQAMIYAKQHVYLPFIFVAVFLLLFLWMIAKVSSRFPDQHLFDVLTEKYPVRGRVILSLYMLFFLFILARDLRILTDFTNVFLLEQTPMLIIGLMFVIPVILMVRGGIEVIGRMTELFFPIFILVIAAIPVLMIKDVTPSFFQPLFAFDWQGIGIGSWYVLGYMGEIMLLPFLFSVRSFSFRYGFYGLALGTVILLIIVIFELLVLGLQLTSRSMFPTYQLVRQINLTDFLDRFELLMVSLYYPSTMIKMAYFLYLTSYTFHKIVPKVSKRLLAAPLGLLAVVLSSWIYGDMVQVFKLNGVQPFFAVIFELFFPLLFFFMLKSKKNMHG